MSDIQVSRFQKSELKHRDVTILGGWVKMVRAKDCEVFFEAGEVNYILKGDATIVYQGKKYAINEGCYVKIPFGITCQFIIHRKLVSMCKFF